MYKSIFILPLPIEIQFKVFKYEHISLFKSISNDIENVCYVCKCVINPSDCFVIPCIEIYIGGLLIVSYYRHWSHRELECFKYDKDIIKKLWNEFDLLRTSHEINIKFPNTNKTKLVKF